MSGPMYCVNHPKVETYLRCNKCGDPICTRCAVQTPVGYRCPTCVSQQQRVFYTGFRPVYYLVAAAVALPLSFVAGWLVPIGWLYAIILGPLAGGGIAEAARWAIRRRRGQYTWLVVCGCIVTGVLPWLLGSLITLNLMRLLWSLIYVVEAVGVAYLLLRPGRRV